jgi:hypothetical protein
MYIKLKKLDSWILCNNNEYFKKYFDEEFLLEFKKSKSVDIKKYNVDFYRECIDLLLNINIILFNNGNIILNDKFNIDVINSYKDIIYIVQNELSIEVYLRNKKINKIRSRI